MTPVQGRDVEDGDDVVEFEGEGVEVEGREKSFGDA